MTRDYKRRAQVRQYDRNRRNRDEGAGAGVFKWMLVTALVIGFVVFLVYLKSPAIQKKPGPSRLKVGGNHWR